MLCATLPRLPTPRRLFVAAHNADTRKEAHIRQHAAQIIAMSAQRLRYAAITRDLSEAPADDARCCRA